jgi:hypothetical protein
MKLTWDRQQYLLGVHIGGIVNKGIEGIISADVVNSEEFRWLIDFNITHYNKQITDLPQEEIIRDTNKLMVGHSVYDFYLRDGNTNINYTSNRFLTDTPVKTFTVDLNVTFQIINTRTP